MGDEKAPLVEMANEMKRCLSQARNTMEEFLSASGSAAVAMDDESAVSGPEATYRVAMEEFDTYAEAMLERATFEDGTVVIRTDSRELADLVRTADERHNDGFQPCASPKLTRVSLNA